MAFAGHYEIEAPGPTCPPATSLCAWPTSRPCPQVGYRHRLPRPGRWLEVLNTDAKEWGGSGLGQHGRRSAEDFRLARVGQFGRDGPTPSGRAVAGTRTMIVTPRQQVARAKWNPGRAVSWASASKQ